MFVDAPFRFDNINEKMFQKSTSIEINEAPLLEMSEIITIFAHEIFNSSYNEKDFLNQLAHPAGVGTMRLGGERDN